MKVNLTKLLDSPTHIIVIGKEPNKTSTGYYHEPSMPPSVASPYSIYSFIIENDLPPIYVGEEL